MADNRPGVLGRLTPQTRALALVCLVVEALFLASLSALNEAQSLYALLICGGLLVIIVAGIVVLEMKHAAPERDRGRGSIICEALEGREDLYKECERLIRGAKKEVIDTTWGPDAPKLKLGEAEALAKYIQARRDAVASKKGFHYRELFTTSEDESRKQRLEEAVQHSQTNNTYEVRVLTGYPRKKSLPDFMVIDREVVLLSHVDADSPRRDYQFLVVRCEELAGLFADWFNECWREAKAVTPENI